MLLCLALLCGAVRANTLDLGSWTILPPQDAGELGTTGVVAVNNSSVEMALYRPGWGDELLNTQMVGLRGFVSLTSGQTLSGLAGFLTEEQAGADAAWVRIFDLSGNLLATPWLATSGTESDNYVDSMYRMAFSPVAWDWTASGPIVAIIELGIGTDGGGYMDSRAWFGELEVSSSQRVANPVPDTAGTGMLLALALFGLLSFRPQRE